MTSFSATSSRSSNLRRILFILFDGALATDIAGPADAFAMVNRLKGSAAPVYALSYLSMKGGPVQTSCGLALDSDRATMERLTDLDTVIVAGGSFIDDLLRDKDLIGWIAQAGSKAGRICSVCSGAFLLAEAGLLDRRRAVTHWADIDAFRARYPRVRLTADPIFVEDGPVWTSAGVTAGIDLALALIGRDFGPALSMTIAQRMVMFLQRPGGQAQFSAPLLAQAALRARDDPLLGIAAYIADNLTGDLSVIALADRAGMTPRTFARQFAHRSQGLTPAKLVESVRVEAAARALSDSADPVKQIALLCGFGDEERMRRAFLRNLGVAPSDYRARFSLSPADCSS
jgi:transcriptional regulator GlxA family with amidase domain